jgi:hypothetical protein
MWSVSQSACKSSIKYASYSICLWYRLKSCAILGLLVFLSVYAPVFAAKDTLSVLDQGEKNQPLVGPQPSMRATYQTPRANAGLYLNTSATKALTGEPSSTTEGLADELSHKDLSSKDPSVQTPQL